MIVFENFIEKINQLEKHLKSKEINPSEVKVMINETDWETIICLVYKDEVINHIKMEAE